MKHKLKVLRNSLVRRNGVLTTLGCSSFLTLAELNPSLQQERNQHLQTRNSFQKFTALNSVAIDKYSGFPACALYPSRFKVNHKLRFKKY